MATSIHGQWMVDFIYMFNGEPAGKRKVRNEKQNKKLIMSKVSEREVLLKWISFNFIGGDRGGAINSWSSENVMVQ